MNFEQVCRYFQSQMQMFSSFSEHGLQEIYLSKFTMLNMLLPRIGRFHVVCNSSLPLLEKIVFQFERRQNKVFLAGLL